MGKPRNNSRADDDRPPAESDESPNSNEEMLRGFSRAMRFANIGWQFVGSFCLLAAAGWWVDREAGSAPAGLLIGCTAGFVLGTWLALAEVKRISRR